MDIFKKIKEFLQDCFCQDDYDKFVRKVERRLKKDSRKFPFHNPNMERVFDQRVFPDIIRGLENCDTVILFNINIIYDPNFFEFQKNKVWMVSRLEFSGLKVDFDKLGGIDVLVVVV